MKFATLNDLYKQFKENIITREKFESLVFNYYFKNQKKTVLSYWKQEEYEDFVSWFYPSLRKAIDKFRDKGPSFEAFINKFFLVSSRDYRVRTITGSITEYSAWSAQLPDLYVHEDEPEYIVADTKIIKKNRIDARRFLALILKCYCYISDDFAEKVAPLIGIDKDELIEMINKIRLLRQKRDDDIYLMKEKVYCQFYRCIVYEKRLLLCTEDTTTYKRLQTQLKTARLKLEKMRAKLNLVKKEATNSQVAEVIGVCKGSVDSSLHKLKEKFSLN